MIQAAEHIIFLTATLQAWLHGIMFGFCPLHIGSIFLNGISNKPTPFYNNHFLTHGCLSGNYSLYSSLFLTNDKTLSIVEFQVLQLHSWSAVCVADKDQIPDLQRLLSSKPKVLSEFCVAR